MEVSKPRAHRETLVTVIPGRNGLECSFYAPLANYTKHLRERLYVALYVPALDKTFIPSIDEAFETGMGEHTPFKVFQDGQRKSMIYGRGVEPLEAAFYCYSPTSAAASEGVAAIEEALEQTASVTHRPHLSRDLFAFKNFYQQARYLKSQGRLPRSYRPPEEALVKDGIRRKHGA